MTDNNYTFRLAQLDDIAFIQKASFDAYKNAYLPAIGALPKPATEDYKPRVNDQQVFLAESKKISKGIIIFETNGVNLKIYSIVVAPDFQGLGIATALLSFAKTHAKHQKYKYVTLFTNVKMVSNIALYEDNGFKTIGKRPHPSREAECLIDLRYDV